MPEMTDQEKRNIAAASERLAQYAEGRWTVATQYSQMKEYDFGSKTEAENKAAELQSHLVPNAVTRYHAERYSL